MTRVRYTPSPVGPPSVGLAHAALFNWVFARSRGGVFVLRLEDTDTARVRPEYEQPQLEALRWLNLPWDEGPEAGGPHAPYRQSGRGDLYAEILRRLREAGEVYPCFSTRQEAAARRAAAGGDPRLGYDNYDRRLTHRQIQGFLAEGRRPVWRLRMPDRDAVVDDLVRGRIVFRAGSVPDPALTRGSGAPLYALANPVDDAVMGITHVLRGESLLPATPGHLALHDALHRIGVAAHVPRFGHLPSVVGANRRRLGRSSPQAHLLRYRDEGCLPEAMVNHLARLGWSPPDGREVFTLADMVASFSLERVSPAPARFDADRVRALNAAHMRLLDPDRFLAAVRPHLERAGLPARGPAEHVLRAALPLVRPRITVLRDAPPLLAFLLLGEEEFRSAEDPRAGLPADEARAALRRAAAALRSLDPWDTEGIARAMRGAVDRGRLGAVRVAVTGASVSLPLYESAHLLGRDRTLIRIGRALALLEGAQATTGPPPADGGR
ncbi:glutamate--tRNA ligase [Streptomyces sp. NPDC088729]|uniref:glutamate--tRNA ligase n=1 Tax=Streptomyces sp. NPDC088729 TaxID=3365876 RepID=UPI00380F2F52